MEIQKNLISVVGTSFKNNRIETKRAIESVLNQKYKNFEFIVVLPPYENNLELFRLYKDKIKIIITKKLLNMSESLKVALFHSRGEYIARIDFDDFFFKDKLQKQINFFKKNNDINILGTGFKTRNIKNNYVPQGSLSIKFYSFFFNPLCHPSVVFKKKIINRNVNYDTKFCAAEDLELWFNCMSKNISLENLKEPLLFYDKIHFMRNKKNFLYNYLSRKKYSIKLFGYFFGVLNIIIFYLYLNFFIKIIFWFQFKFLKNKFR
jgi:glycosyltransferase involved in cell wall biosynthesis